MPNRYFFEGRNTGIIADSASAARAKKKGAGIRSWQCTTTSLPPRTEGGTAQEDGKSPAKSSYGNGGGRPRGSS